MGRFGDRLVGRDVLIGAAAGVLVVVIQRLKWLVPQVLGAPPRMPYSVLESTLLGGAKALAPLVMPRFLSGPLLLLFALTMSILLRRRRGAAVAVASLLLMLSDAHWVFWSSQGLLARVSALLEVVLVWAVLFATLLRFGLLALVSAFFFAILQRWPLTFDAAAWYSGTSLLGVLILAAVAGGALFVARGGASAWRRAVLGTPSGAGV